MTAARTQQITGIKTTIRANLKVTMHSEKADVCSGNGGDGTPNEAPTTSLTAPTCIRCDC